MVHLNEPLFLSPSVFRDHVHYTEDVEKETAAFVFEQLKPYMGIADDGGE